MMNDNLEYKVSSIQLYTPSGEREDNMARKAILASVENKCEVSYYHNDRLFKVQFKDLIDKVKQTNK